VRDRISFLPQLNPAIKSLNSDISILPYRLPTRGKKKKLRRRRRIRKKIGCSDMYELIRTHKPVHCTPRTYQFLLNMVIQSYKNWVAERHVAFRMEDVTKVTDKKSNSVSKEDRKLRCIHAVAVQAQSVATDSLLGQNQEMFVHVETGNSEQCQKFGHEPSWRRRS
jgi:hypothetical protein